MFEERTETSKVGGKDLTYIPTTSPQLPQRNFNFQELNKLLEFDKKSAH